LFVVALFCGAGSTALYALTQGFWPLLLGRLLWGLAWVGIWVGGNTIIMDISDQHSRGRWVGFYQIFFFLGASGGAMSGGLLTDWLGYHRAMGVSAALTLLGAVFALILLPETRRFRERETGQNTAASLPPVKVSRQAELFSAVALLGLNRLLVAGMLASTFGLLLLAQLGESIELAGHTVGVATLTGLGLGSQSLLAMAAAPLMGGLSDRVVSRWQVAASGLSPGVAGFGLMALGSPVAILAGLPLAAITSGSNQSLSTAIVGDLAGHGHHGRQLGWLFTIGDLASAIGPPLAYALIPWLGLSRLYGLAAGLLGLMLLAAGRWAMKPVH
jgi:MFS family permease